jgi:hypothetical protein
MLPPALPNSKAHGKVNKTQFLEYFCHANHLYEKFPFQNASALARGANYLKFTPPPARSFVRPPHRSYLIFEPDSHMKIGFVECLVKRWIYSVPQKKISPC